LKCHGIPAMRRDHESRLLPFVCWHALFVGKTTGVIFHREPISIHFEETASNS